MGVEWYDPLVGKWDEDRQPSPKWLSRYKGLITCQDCGTAYGWHTHHSTSSTFRKAVWECRISYKKRGTCETGWLHDTELQAYLAQFLLRRLFHDPDLVAAIGDALSSASTAHRGAVSTSMATTMTRAAQTLAAHPDDVTAHIAWG